MGHLWRRFLFKYWQPKKEDGFSAFFSVNFTAKRHRPIVILTKSSSFMFDRMRPLNQFIINQKTIKKMFLQGLESFVAIRETRTISDNWIYTDFLRNNVLFSTSAHQYDN